ncbi:MAG: aminomethyl-transferring glycine dehydrogenase subunit GcvPB [Candidatus Riflebacteria bacterium]|nr:aminomethyl-transferring glycine dehydrogenase subunit GcvPB [Candidatus Riflebacteria bacterium]
MTEPLIFELSNDERISYQIPALDVPAIAPEEVIDSAYLRKELNMPVLSERDTVMHFTRLSRLNYSVDSGFYPLGSCTMKYNPKINEDIARLPGFARVHPKQPAATIQGIMEVHKLLSDSLAELTAMDAMTLQPAAGAQGELTGLLVMAAYHKKKGNTHKNKIIIPDSGHGTNPASVSMAGFEVLNVESDEDGCVDMEKLKKVIGPEVAGIMLTNPNTLGLFEKHAKELSETLHSVDALLYYDGANFNAIMGWARPGDMGFDIVHLNVHKTLSTPHGGGGPGAGPVGVKAHLAEFLPVPRIKEENGKLAFSSSDKLSLGSVVASNGNFLVLLKALAYIVQNGGDGLKHSSACAVLNANYMMEKLKAYYHLPYDRLCKHEFVITSENLADYGVKTLDVAKRLLDYGFHAPTVYFPLIVPEAMMIEPTETETRGTLDSFIEAMIKIAEEAKTNPDLLKEAPHNTPVRRLDETTAARKPDINWYKRPE